MKKIFIFAVIAAVALTACNQNEQNFKAQVPELKAKASSIELTASVRSALTRADEKGGYVEGATFYDTPYDKLHTDPATDPSPRTMRLSAYVTPVAGQSFLADNYFVNEEFAFSESDNKWHHNPRVYWPMGGELSFLAISTRLPFKGTALNWDELNASSKVVIDVSEEYLQDDILYSACAQRSSGASHSTTGTTTTYTPAEDVAMTFDHAQAWIQFQIQTAGQAGMENVVKLKDIVIKDLYTRGELTIEPDASVTSSGSKSTWNFRKETAVDKVMDDTYGVTAAANFITENVQYMDMLVPTQKQTTFIMHYTLAGQDTVLEYKYDLATSTWQNGSKYIYKITFAPYEIIVTPSVTKFSDVDPGATGFPSTLE